MAILGKYRKNKKEGRNSILPKPSDSSTTGSNGSTTGHAGPAPDGSPTSATDSRQVSNSSSTMAGAYDSMPAGAAPDTKYQNPNPSHGPAYQMRSPSGSSIPTKSPTGQYRASSGGPPPGGPPGHKSPPPQAGVPPGYKGNFPPQQQQQHYNKNLHSQFPWSQVAISNASPFPRYGHAANPVAARDGEVFVMGGLKGSNVFGDLWVIDSGK